MLSGLLSSQFGQAQIEFKRKRRLVKIGMRGVSVWLAMCVLGGGYAFQASAQDTVVGKMGSIEIKTSEMQRLIDAQPPEVRKQITSGLTELDRLARSELVRQSLLAEAKSKGWDKKPEVLFMMERTKEDTLLQLYISDVVRAPAGYPSEDDVKKAYEANRSAFPVPAQLNLAQIFLAVPENADKQAAAATQKKAADLAAKARTKGADFAQLAKENSDHKDTAPKGGDLGWLPETQVLPEIRAAAEKMEKGEVSMPIRTATGWHIVKLIDKKPASTRPLSEVRDAIVTQMRQRRAQELQRKYVEEMVSRSQPTVNQVELSKLQTAK
jgi:parvulin-like peptidyl-prolyl isomerase